MDERCPASSLKSIYGCSRQKDCGGSKIESDEEEESRKRGWGVTRTWNADD